MPLNLAPEIKGLLSNKLHHFATLWDVDRQDGVSYYFTDHDTDVTFEARQYKAAGGFNASAREKNAGVREHNLDAVGVIDSSFITEDDLRAGRYDNAKVTERVVDYRFPYAGSFTKNVYWIVKLTYTREQWQAQLSGQPAWLQLPVGSTYGQGCRNRLGDSLCRVDLPGLKQYGTVSVVDTDSPLRRWTSTGLSHAPPYWVDGLVTWTFGDNTGFKGYVKLQPSNTVIETQLNFPYAVRVGDVFSVEPGCDHTTVDCIAKFDNILNYGGFPFMPGTDALIKAI